MGLVPSNSLGTLKSRSLPFILGLVAPSFLGLVPSNSPGILLGASFIPSGMLKATPSVWVPPSITRGFFPLLGPCNFLLLPAKTLGGVLIVAFVSP